MPFPVPSGQAMNPFIFAPVGFDKGFLDALRASDSKPCRINIVGDSIVQGLRTSDWILKRFGRLFRNALVNSLGYPLGGDFYHMGDSHSFVSAENNWPGTGAPWVLDEVNGTRSNFSTGLGVATVWTTNALDDIARFNAPDAHLDADVIYWDYSVAGSWKWSVDGGARTVLNTVGASLSKRFRLPTDGTIKQHYYQFGTQSADQRMIIHGVATYLRRGFGLQFATIGQNGQSAQGMFQNTVLAIPPDQAKLLGGFDNAAWGFGFPTQPDLLIFALGVNDCQTWPASLSGYERVLHRVVRSVRRGNPNATIVFITPWLSDGRASDATATASQETNWPHFQMIVNNVARLYNCAWINIDAKWGEVATASGFITGNDIHPVDAGHADIFSSLAALLLDKA